MSRHLRGWCGQNSKRSWLAYHRIERIPGDHVVLSRGRPCDVWDGQRWPCLTIYRNPVETPLVAEGRLPSREDSELHRSARKSGHIFGVNYHERSASGKIDASNELGAKDNRIESCRENAGELAR